MTNKLFSATTLQTTNLTLEGPLVHRTRVIDLINNAPGAGVISWIFGPIGSGKSTIARQWAVGRNSDIQLVSARPEKHGVQAHLGSPTPFGLALENLLNTCSREHQSASESEIAAALDVVIERSADEQQSFILDDLELIRRESMTILQRLFMHALPRLQIDRGMFISRTIDAHILSALQAQRSMRMVLPSTLEFDQRETTEAHRIGVFGDASLEDVGAARERSAGWISGMLTELYGHGGSTISRSTFGANILNDMLLFQPPSILRCMWASSMLPYTTTDLWGQWFTELGIPHWIIPSTLTQLATRPLEGDGDRFVVVPAMASALRSYRGITISENTIRDLLLIAMKWYVANDAAVTAAKVANEHHLETEYLQMIKPKVAELSRAEEWQEVGKLVEDLSVSAISTDPDICFWYGYALAGANRWSEMVDLHYRTSEEWSASESDLIRGRNHLTKGWIARAHGNYEEALEHYERAYETLPPSAHQERMYAAASAGTTESQIRLGQNRLLWRERTAFELSHLPPEQRWWHGNMGPVALGYIASAGKMDQAFRQAKQQVVALNNINPRLSWRYLLLLARIAVERLQFESAADLLEKAQLRVQTPLQLQMFAQAESMLLAARGEYELAGEKLNLQPFAVGRSINNEFIAKLTKASQAFDSGDASTAAFMLENVAWPVDAWPRNFGDTHPNLILAMIRAELGEREEGLELANEVLEEAEYRRDRFIETRSHVVLAFIHHLTNNATARDHEIHMAMECNAQANYQLLFFIKGQDVRTLETPTGEVAERSNAHSRLTSREAQVLELVSESLSNKQIAETMFISVSTVKNHLASVYDKLGTNNRRAAVRIAQQLNLIPD